MLVRTICRIVWFVSVVGGANPPRPPPGAAGAGPRCRVGGGGPPGPSAGGAAAAGAAAGACGARRCRALTSGSTLLHGSRDESCRPRRDPLFSTALPESRSCGENGDRENKNTSRQLHANLPVGEAERECARNPASLIR